VVQKEPYIPSTIIDRKDRTNWVEGGSKSIFERAQEKVKDILENHQPRPLAPDKEKALDQVIRDIMTARNIADLPFSPK
jgi:trimethylamine---corrinoid protein Co-methyltransferase